MDDFWIFAYGSLMWNPGFSCQNAHLSRLFGYHRSLCIYSHHYRGTPERPGLILGLKRGGSCRGVAFHVAKDKARKTYAYLIRREQVNSVYKEKHVDIYLEDGNRVKSLVFIADPEHPQYAGTLAPHNIARIVSAANGKTGSNQEYVLNTVRHLRTLDIRDRLLEKIAEKLMTESSSP